MTISILAILLKITTITTIINKLVIIMNSIRGVVYRISNLYIIHHLSRSRKAKNTKII